MVPERTVPADLAARRQALRLGLATASALWLPRGAWSQPRLRDDPFVLGVASGTPSATSVVLWTRLMAGPERPLAESVGPVTVRWEVAHDAAFAQVVHRGQFQALPELAHAVHVEVQGLAPDRWYHYRFIASGIASPVGRTRTLPEPQALPARLRLAYASCQRWEHGYFSAWRHLAQEQPDLVLFLGDYLYEYPGNQSPVRTATGGWLVTLRDYRRRHALYKTDPDLQAIHAACPWAMTWDDHEVQNNYAGVHAGYSGAADPVPPGEFAARRLAAYQAYYEHMPLPASVLAYAMRGLGRPGGGPRIHREMVLGRLATLVLLDGRQYRDAAVCTGPQGAALVDPQACAAWNDPARSLLGTAQEQWLDALLARRSTGERRWTLLAQQTVFGPRDFRSGPGQRFSNDGWDGYAAARQRLTTQLERTAAPNPVFLGGDVHANWVGHVKSDYAREDSRTLGVEFCGTSITSHGGNNDRMAERLRENPHFVLADAERRGYGIVDLAPQGLHTQLRAVDDVARQDSGVSTLATFAVEAGRPVLERA